MAKICNRIGSASRSRSNSEPSDQRIAGRGHEAVQVVQRHVRIARLRQMLGQLIAETASRSSVRPAVAMLTRLAWARSTSHDAPACRPAFRLGGLSRKRCSRVDFHDVRCSRVASRRAV